MISYIKIVSYPHLFSFNFILLFVLFLGVMLVFSLIILSYHQTIFRGWDFIFTNIHTVVIESALNRYLCSFLFFSPFNQVLFYLIRVLFLSELKFNLSTNNLFDNLYFLIGGLRLHVQNIYSGTF